MPMHPFYSNRRLLISVGPMRTEIDSVRYVQNRSSGKFGLAIARQAARLGARPHILLGPVASEIAHAFGEFETTPYTSPADYERLLHTLWPQFDDFFSLAAVLDFEVVPAVEKIARESLGEVLSLPIRPVPDFAAWAGAAKQKGQRLIAFAAETGTPDEIQTRARAKMLKKRADAIVANPVTEGRGPEAQENEIWILRHAKATVHLGPADKSELALPLLETLAEPE